MAEKVSLAEATHVIAELDRDYRVVTDTFYMKFNSDEEAEAYCREKSWTGFSYYAYTKERYFKGGGR